MRMRPIKGQLRSNTRSILPSWLAVFADVFIIYIAYTNLGYNKRAAESSAQIAEQLKTINHSNFMYKLNGELEREEMEKQARKKLEKDNRERIHASNTTNISG